MKSILDPSFRYTPSVATDVRKPFERIRQTQCESLERSFPEYRAPVVAAPLGVDKGCCARHAETYLTENESTRTAPALASRVSRIKPNPLQSSAREGHER
jgi:hypothetical protein